MNLKNYIKAVIAFASVPALSVGIVLGPLPSRAFIEFCPAVSFGDCTQNGPGTAGNPLLPTNVIDGSFVFENIPVDPGPLLFIDPLIAIGYDYTVTGGPLFSQVVAPSGINASNLFTLIYGTTTVPLTANVLYTFTTPQSSFRIQGIDVAAGLDPANPLAFITGVSFGSTGLVNISQKPIVFDTSSVPAPLPLLGAGTAFGLSRKLRKRIKSSKPKAISMPSS